MPVYEYVCQKCEGVTEALRKMSDADTTIRCEHCGAKQTARVQSVFSAGSAQSGPSMPMGGCGRCGDPNGSCGI